MKNKILIILVISLLIPLVNAGLFDFLFGQDGKLDEGVSLPNSGTARAGDWKITKYDNLEFDNWIINLTKNDKNATICLYPKNKLKSTDKYFQDLEIKTKTTNIKDKIKLKENENKEISEICLNVYSDNEKYIKIGNSTIIIEYISENKIVYDFDWGQTNLTLYKKNNSGTYVIGDNLFVYWNQTSYKFGALDNYTGDYLKDYSYVLNSTRELVLLTGTDVETGINYPLFYNYYPNGYDELRQMYNFKDICSKSYSKCSYSVQGNSGIINFRSYKQIDPTIENVTGCKTLSSADTYYTLNQTINANIGSGSCMIINNDSITLDCLGYPINITSSTSSGIITVSAGDKSNITIKNCKLKSTSGQDYGIKIINDGNFYNNVSIYNNTLIVKLSFGIYVRNLTNSTINLNFVNYSARYSIYLEDVNDSIIYKNTIPSYFNDIFEERSISLVSSFNNNLTNNLLISGMQHGLYLYESGNNSIFDSLFNKSSIYDIFLGRNPDNKQCLNNNGGLTSCSNITGDNSTCMALNCSSSCDGSLSGQCYELNENACGDTNSHCSWGSSACAGNPSNSDCGQYTSENDCGLYSSHCSQCNWNPEVQQDCSGTTSDCSSWNYDEGGCNAHSLICYWSDPDCLSNGQTNCDTWDSDESSCTSAGCSWTPYSAGYCSGSMSCSCVSEGDCLSGVPGCVWSSCSNVDLSACNQVGTNYACLSLTGCTFSCAGTLVGNCVNITSGNTCVNYTSSACIWNFTNFFSNYLYNVTYNMSNEFVENASTLYRYWYFNALVKSSGTGLQNANVTLWNRLGNLIFSVLTNAQGLTPIYNILYYINNASAFTYYNDSTINVTLASYNNFTEAINISTNTYNYSINLTSSAGDTTPPYFTTIPANPTIYINTSVGYLFVGTDETAFGTYAVNDTTNFNINSTGYLKNITGLSVGVYNLNITINDTSNNKNSTLFKITVNAIPDTSYPLFSNSVTSPTNNTQYSNNNYQFNITITNSNGTAGIEFNNINYTMSNISKVFNKTFSNLGAGTYSYYYWSYGNGTSHLFNKSSVYSYTIAKNSSLVLTLTATTPITYPTATNFAGSGCPSELSCTLNITNGIFSAGTINANYSTSGNNNYSSTSTIKSVTINQNTSAVIYTYLNNSRANITIFNNTAILLNATLFNVTGIINLYKNGTLINTGNSPISNLTSFNQTGMYNITAIYYDSINYSESIETWWVNVTADNTNPNATLIFPINNTYNSSTSQNFTANLTDNIELKNATLFIYNETGIYNRSEYNFTSVPQVIISKTITLIDGVYKWWVELFDWVGNTYSTENNTLTIDTIKPSIKINYPVNSSSYSFNGVINITLNVTASDNQIDSMWYSQNNGSTNTSFINLTYIILSQPLDSTQSHTIYVWVNDSAGNINSTSTTFSVTQLMQPGGTGGGGIGYNNKTIEDLYFLEKYEPIIFSNITEEKRCNFETISNIKNCIVFFIEGTGSNWLILILMISGLIIITEYYDIGIGRLIVGKRKREKEKDESNDLF